MSQTNGQSEIARAAVECFADDGTIDLGELNRLLGLALRNNEIDEEERRVLGDVISRLSEATVTPVVWQRIEEIERMRSV